MGAALVGRVAVVRGGVPKGSAMVSMDVCLCSFQLFCFVLCFSIGPFNIGGIILRPREIS